MQGKSGKWLGKLPTRDLAGIISMLHVVRHPSTRVGPRPGEDAAVIDLGMCDLVAHVDPITEAGRLAGWLAIHVASNDVAVTGARPMWAMVTILLREGAGGEELEEVARGVMDASREVGVEIVGGHTEVTPGLSKSIVQAAVLGCTCRGCAVLTSNARPGDLVLQVKPAGLEGTAIIATDFEDLLVSRGVGPGVVQEARGFYRRVSVVREALALAESGVVNSMHDPTEGGLIGGLVEIGYASGKSITVHRDKVLIGRPTQVISRALGLDPLKLISSGTLLATVPRDRLDRAVEVLGSLGVEYSVIGFVEEYKGYYLRVIGDGGAIEYNDVPMDEITRVASSAGEG